MSELTLTIIRLGLLVLLWIFVFSVVGVLRGDLYGTRVVSRTPAQARPGQRGSPRAAPRGHGADDAPSAQPRRGSRVPALPRRHRRAR